MLPTSSPGCSFGPGTTRDPPLVSLQGPWVPLVPLGTGLVGTWRGTARRGPGMLEGLHAWAGEGVDLQCAIAVKRGRWERYLLVFEAWSCHARHNSRIVPPSRPLLELRPLHQVQQSLCEAGMVSHHPSTHPTPPHAPHPTPPAGSTTGTIWRTVSNEQSKPRCNCWAYSGR